MPASAYDFRSLSEWVVVKEKRMSGKSLEDVLNAAGNPAKLLRNSQTGPYIYPVVPAEFSNWRDEQRAWRDTCIFFNQSYHMTDMYMEGPDALKVLTMLGVNSFKDFGPNRAKQFVPCNYDGYVIGDVILFHLEETASISSAGRRCTTGVAYHVETGSYNVKLERDGTIGRASRRAWRSSKRTAIRCRDRTRCRSWRRSRASRCRTSSSST